MASWPVLRWHLYSVMQFCTNCLRYMWLHIEMYSMKVNIIIIIIIIIICISYLSSSSSILFVKVGIPSILLSALLSHSLPFLGAPSQKSSYGPAWGSTFSSQAVRYILSWKSCLWCHKMNNQPLICVTGVAGKLAVLEWDTFCASLICLRHTALYKCVFDLIFLFDSERDVRK